MKHKEKKMYIDGTNGTSLQRISEYSSGTLLTFTFEGSNQLPQAASQVNDTHKKRVTKEQ